MNHDCGISVEEMKIVALEAAFFILDKFDNPCRNELYPYWKLVSSRNITRLILLNKRQSGQHYVLQNEYRDDIGNPDSSLHLDYTQQDNIVNDEFFRYIVQQVAKGDMGAKFVFQQLQGVDLQTIAKSYHLSMSSTKKYIKDFKNKLKKSFFGK